MVKINYLSRQDYQKMLLQKGRKIFSSDSSDFYQVGINSILKDYQYEKFSASGGVLLQLLENWKEILIEQSKLTNFEELLKAQELWLVDGFLKGIEMPLIPYGSVDFEDYINSCGNNMEVICKNFSSLNTIFERGSELDLVFLDTITKGNLKINPVNSSITVCDGEGIQTKKVFPFIASTLLNLEVNDAIMHKYFGQTSRGIYAKTNLNRLAIITYFIKLCTRYVWITETYPGLKPNQAIELILDGIGLIDDEILAPVIRNIYGNKDIPKIDDDRWNEFGKAYTLVPTGYGLEQSGGYAFKRR